MKNEEDLLAPVLYKDIIGNEEITEKDCEYFHNHILSFNQEELNNLVKNLSFFKNIPFEVLSKYWARFYTAESNFYKVLNNNLMKSNLSSNYKVFIKMLYKGVEIDSIKSYRGKNLFRGSNINKTEVEKINKYKALNKLSTIVVFSKAFLSFSEDIEKAKTFCGNSDDKKFGCLYILENNNNNFHESNAAIKEFSFFPKENEILFFPGSSFIIKDINLTDNIYIIILNYNGKFKEKYSFVYYDKMKINNLISNNILTKIIAGKQLIFLNGGKYLIKGLIEQRHYGKIYLGKNLKTDEYVSIKEIIGNKNVVIIIKKVSYMIKDLMKIKDIFNIKGIFYIIEDYYDGDLRPYRRISPNLIKKIFIQLNDTFKNLYKQGIIHNNICPYNINIKYSNQKKTNFDSILTGYGYTTYFNKLGIIPSLGTPSFVAPEVSLSNYRQKSDLFSIGMTIYYLYFGFLPDSNGLNELNIKIEEDKQLEDLLKKILKRDPKERISWIKYFDHPFFKQYEY